MASQAIADANSEYAQLAPATRRDFIHILTGAMAAGGAAAVAWPFIDQWNPASNTLAAGSPVKVDISKIQPGAQITVLWRQNPMFIVRRTPAMLEQLTKPNVLDMLRDPDFDERAAAGLRKELVALAEAGIPGADRCLHAPRVRAGIHAGRGRRRTDLAGRLALPLPRVEVRSGRARFQVGPDAALTCRCPAL